MNRKMSSSDYVANVGTKFSLDIARYSESTLHAVPESSRLEKTNDANAAKLAKNSLFAESCSHNTVPLYKTWSSEKNRNIT